MVRALAGVALALAVLGQARAHAGALEFFTWAPRTPPVVLRVLDRYASADPLRAAVEADRALADPTAQAFREELLLLRGLAFEDSGRVDEAETSFAELLDRPDPSAYAPLAILETIELRHAAGRTEGVAEACARRVMDPLAGRGPHAPRRKAVLESFGDLRGPGRLTEDERSLLLHPTRLAESTRVRKERPTERILYLCGSDLLRLGRFAASHEAFDRIAITSPYYPWGLYAAAQDLYALGRIDDATAALERLRALPPGTMAEAELASRAGLLNVQMLYVGGRAEQAIAAAELPGDRSPWPFRARLLRAEIATETSSPSLALAWFRDLEEASVDPALDAERALALDAVYARLDDPSAASAVLRAAAERLAARRARLEPPNLGSATAELRDAVEQAAARRERTKLARRQRIALGLRRALAVRGPANLGKLVRIVLVSHRDTVLGEPVVDVGGLSRSEPDAVPTGAAGGLLLAAFLESAERRSIERAADLRRALGEGSADDRAEIVSAALLELLHGPIGAGLAPRERAALAAEAEEGSASAAESVRDRLGAALDHAIDGGLARVAAAEVAELRRLQFEVESALSSAMLRENQAARGRAGGS